MRPFSCAWAIPRPANTPASSRKTMNVCFLIMNEPPGLRGEGQRAASADAPPSPKKALQKTGNWLTRILAGNSLSKDTSFEASRDSVRGRVDGDVPGFTQSRAASAGRDGAPRPGPGGARTAARLQPGAAHPRPAAPAVNPRIDPPRAGRGRGAPLRPLPSGSPRSAVAAVPD